jgi:hypothetical protein
MPGYVYAEAAIAMTVANAGRGDVGGERKTKISLDGRSIGARER